LTHLPFTGNPGVRGTQDPQAGQIVVEISVTLQTANQDFEPMPPPQLTSPLSASAQRRQFAAAYSVLETAIAEQAFPGAAFSVFANGQVLALDGLGGFTYDPLTERVTASTVFDLASITKVIATTSLAMLLYQRGKLPLDQPLVHILPAFAQGEAAGSARQQVTLRMLLAHASGLPGYVRLFTGPGGREELLDACLRLPLEAAPGSRAEYSDPGFILLGQALEAIAGEPMETFCAREVFIPLGMTSTCFRPPPDWRSAIPPTEEDLTFRHRIIQGEVQDENCFVLGGVGGHAGLFSNALDPLLYAQCLLGMLGSPRSTGWTALERPLFTPEAIQVFTSRAELPPGSSRALGWDTPSQPSSSGKLFSRHSAGHLGYAGTSLWIDFERKIAVVLLTNRTWPSRKSQAIRSIRPAFHDAVIQSLGERGRQVMA
jgi:CubicO group peptidase (beta-lactamase class C family)